MSNKLDEIEKLIKTIDEDLKYNLDVKDKLLQEVEIYKTVLSLNEEEVKKVNRYLDEGSDKTISVNLALSSGGILEYSESRKLPFIFWNAFSNITSISRGVEQVKGKADAEKILSILLNFIKTEKEKTNKNEHAIKIIEKEYKEFVDRKEYLISKKKNIIYKSSIDVVDQKIHYKLKSEKVLVNQVIKVCMTCHLTKLPTYDQLKDYSETSKSEWNRRFFNASFLNTLNDTLTKKINSKAIKENNRNNLIKIQLEIHDRIHNVLDKIEKKKEKNSYREF
jgi:hypothetical protein